ncbi:MAG: hypothetical protein Q9M92_09100 [Enterobacterales bacterium]|nr:hypothetical protein [Enterobacterales bacterium]
MATSSNLPSLSPSKNIPDAEFASSFAIEQLGHSQTTTNEYRSSHW